MMTPNSNPNDPARRSFLTRAMAAVIGGILALFPFAAGWGVLTDPLRRRSGRSADNDNANLTGFVRVGPLDMLPADGVPRAFPVTTDVVDAWTRTPNQRIGTVFLARENAAGEPRITAFTATCPHLGCAVDFHPAADRFECPCHESAFARDGSQMFGPSLRGLDPLEVRIADHGGEPEIWVAFRDYRPGIAERIPIG